MPVPMLTTEFYAQYSACTQCGGGVTIYFTLRNHSAIPQTGTINFSTGLARVFRSHYDFNANVTVSSASLGQPSGTTTLSGQSFNQFTQSFSVPANGGAGVSVTGLFTFVPVAPDYTADFIFAPVAEIIINEDRGAVSASFVPVLLGSNVPGVASPINLPALVSTQTGLVNGGRPF